MLWIDNIVCVAEESRGGGARGGGCGFHQAARTEIEDEAFTKDTYNVLFLCTGNSARSITAEAIMNLWGRPRFTSYSAGSHPSGKVRPEALRELEAANLPTADARSKNWTSSPEPSAPAMDFVFTVCDNAAKEVCQCGLASP